MTAVELVSQLPDLLRLVSDEPPEDEDVKAGWVGLVVFIGLAVAVVFLGLSLVKQLRKAEAAKDAGVYGDPPASEEAEPDEPAADDA